MKGKDFVAVRQDVRKPFSLQQGGEEQGKEGTAEPRPDERGK